MISPSLPIVPQWLKLVLCVKRALGILLAYEKMEAQAADLECGPVCRHKGPSYLPFLCLIRLENLARH